MDKEIIAVSTQGRGQQKNQDFSLFFSIEDKEFWLIADGSTNAKNSGDFISCFFTMLKEFWISAGTPTDEHEIRTLIKDVHEQVKRKFICAKGAFLLLIIDLHSDYQHCFYLGDCRFGVVNNGFINWINTPHSLPCADGVRDELTICKDPSRQILYKVLKAKRHEEPEHLLCKIDLNKTLVFATDGYWSCYPSKLPAPLSEQTIRLQIEQLETTDDVTIMVREGSYTEP